MPTKSKTILSFTATEAGTEENEYALVAGVTSPRQYVTFQRDAEEGPNDCGIHFEFNSQMNGAYECIRRCSLSRDSLCVELIHPIDAQKRITSVDIGLRITDAAFTDLADMLRRIFRHKEAMLEITAERQ